MRTEKRLFTVLLLFILVCFHLGGETFPEHDKSLSFVYSDIAVSLFEEGNPSAVDLAEIALEFYPLNGDAGFVYGLTQQGKEGVSLHETAGVLEKAYSKGAWKLCSREDCRIKLAGIFDQLMQYDRLDALMHDLPEDIIRSADWYYYAARSLFKQDKVDQARIYLEEGTALFPLDSALVIFRVKIDPDYADMLIQNYFSSAAVDLPDQEVVASLAAASDSSVRDFLLGEVGKSGYHALEAEILTAEDAVLFPEKEYDLSPLLNETFLTRLNYFNRIMALYNRYQQIEVFWEFLEGKTIVVQGDNNNDGYVEEYYTLANGTVVDYSIDLDQDGIIDYRVDFISENLQSGSIPSVQKVSVFKDGESYIYHYGKYPSVSSVEADWPDGTGKILLAPGRFAVPAVSYFPGPLAVRIKPAVFPAYSEMEEAAYYSEENLEKASVVRRNSRPPLMMNNEGLIRTVETDTYRKIERDLDNDGIYEIVETYDSADGTRIDLDYNSDGVVDYSYSSSNGNEQWTWLEYPASAE